MDTFLTILKRWWPSILAGVGALWGVFGTQIQALISAHPRIDSVLGALAVVIAHMLTSPANATVVAANNANMAVGLPSVASPTANVVSAGPNVKSGLGMILIIGFISFGLMGCNPYSTANDTALVIGQIVSLAQADLPSLAATGVFSSSEQTTASNYLAALQAADSQASTCVASAHTAGNKKGAFLTCFNTFAAALQSPAELALLRVLNPKAQAKVQLWVTAVTLALNGALDALGAQQATTPQIAAAGPSSADLFVLRERLGL
jgi:hypothetical protein